MNIENDIKRWAIIDLGTNTFHILIVEIGADKSWKPIVRERAYVKLGEGGVEEISSNAWKRGVQALTHFVGKANELGCENILAVGTAALRNAQNASEFVAEIKRTLGLRIDVIDGSREASLISLGVTATLPPVSCPYLIMDIGGGSVEFIYRSSDHRTLFAKSYPIGVAILHQQFHQNDPISESEIEAINQHLSEVLKDLMRFIEPDLKIKLVGASGTFDVLEDLLDSFAYSEALSIADVQKFPIVYAQIIHGSLAERLSNSKIPDARAELIVVAMQLINFTLTRFNIDEILISKYAMKEGILIEMIKSLD